MSQPRLHVESHGQGPAIVWAHGFAGSARNWRPQVRALQSAYRVVVYDARGHARSFAPEEASSYSALHFVDDLEEVVDGCGDPSPVVGGLSMGAATVLQWAIQHPGGARALILAAFPADVGSGRGVSASAEAFADLIEAEGIEAAGARFAWGPGSGLDERGAALVRQGFLEHPPHGLAHTLREYLGRRAPLASHAAALERLLLPVLVVVGERDEASRPTCEWLAQTLPRGELMEIPDAGHVVNLARPDAYNEAVTGFLSRHAPPEETP